MIDDIKNDEPDWNAENINHKKGDTTFKLCGWCDHQGCGSYRYGCMLNGSCTLSRYHGLGLSSEEVKWDTKCRIAPLGKNDLQSIIETKEYSIDECHNKIKYIKEEIEVLDGLYEKAEWKPPLPNSRPSDYYNEGDGIWVFRERKWYHGIVVPGYRHHDGCVSYVLDEFPESKPNNKGPWGSGYAVPGILTDKEMVYFKAVPEGFKEWSALCDKDYNGEKAPMEEMYRALQTM